MRWCQGSDGHGCAFPADFRCIGRDLAISPKGMVQRLREFPSIGESRTAVPVEPGPPRPRIRPNLFAVIARAAVRRRLAMVLAILTFASVCGGIGLARFAVEPDIEGRFVLDPAYAEAAAALDKIFPHRAAELVATVEAENADTARAAAVALVREFRARPNEFGSVMAPGLGKFYEENAILYVSREEAKRIAAGLEGRAPLFRAVAAFPNLAGLAALARQVETSLAAGASPEGLEGFLAAAANTVAGEVEGRPRPLDWTGLVELTPRIEATRWRVEANVLGVGGIDTARRIVGDVAGKAQSAVSIKLGGRAIEREALGNRSVYGVTLASILGLVLAAVTLAAGLGSLRLAAAVFAALLVLAFIALALPTFDGGGVDAVSMFYLPLVLLIGAEIFCAHALRASEEEEKGYGRASAIVLSAHRLGLSSLFIACGALAGLAWFTSNFLSMRNLAPRLAIGVAVAAFLALTLLPALMAFGQPRAEGRHWLDALLDTAGNRFWRKLRAAAAAAGLVVAGAGALVLASGPKLAPERVEDTVVHVLAPAAEAAALAKRLGALKEAANVRTIDRFLPENQADNIAELAKLAGLYPERSADIGRREETEMRADFDRLMTSLMAIGAAGDVSPGLAEATNALRRSLTLFDTPLPAGQDQLRRLEVALFGGLDALLGRIARLTALKPLTSDTIDPQVADRFLAIDGRWRIELSGTPGIAAERFAEAVRAVTPRAVGPAMAANAMAGSPLPSPAAALVGLLALLAFFLVFRRGRAVLVALTTMAGTVFFFVGLMVLAEAIPAASQAPVIVLFAILAGAIACRPTLAAERSRFGVGSARRAAFLAGATKLMAALPMLLAPASALHDTGRIAALAAASLIGAAVVLQPQLAHWAGLETWRFGRRAG